MNHDKVQSTQVQEEITLFRAEVEQARSRQGLKGSEFILKVESDVHFKWKEQLVQRHKIRIGKLWTQVKSALLPVLVKFF